MELLKVLVQMVLPSETSITHSPTPSVRTICWLREMDCPPVALKICQASEFGLFGGRTTFEETRKRIGVPNDPNLVARFMLASNIEIGMV